MEHLGGPWGTRLCSEGVPIILLDPSACAGACQVCPNRNTCNVIDAGRVGGRMEELEVFAKQLDASVFAALHYARKGSSDRYLYLFRKAL